MNILVMGATGMFGSGIVRALNNLNQNIKITAVVRDMNKAKEMKLHQLHNVALVVGDMENPDSLSKIMKNINKLFLVSPMVNNLDVLEMNVFDAAKQQNVNHILKLYGAVKHNDDLLIKLHRRSLIHLEQSGLNWSLISPNSVMETSLLSYAESIKTENAIDGCTGQHKIGMVALDDVLVASAHLLAGDKLISGRDYQLTGPQSLNFFEIAAIFSKCLNKNIQYIDHSEEACEKLLMEHMNMSKQAVEMQIMCHFRAWKQDGADFVTDTFTEITGKPSTSLESWIKKNKDMFLCANG